jgi:putative membrane protein
MVPVYFIVLCIMLLDKKLPFRYIFKDIYPDLGWVLLMSGIFQLLKQFFLSSLPVLPLQLSTVLGGGISLLLAFNIGQSYDRWWEARKVWGAIINDSRSLVLQGQGFLAGEAVPAPGPAAALRDLAYRQIAWCYSLGQALRGLDGAAGLAPFLAESEQSYLQAHINKPLALLALHTNQLRALYQQGALNTYQHVQMDATLVRLCDAQGRAERIRNTIFPTSYRLLIHFFIYLFLGTLSLSLVETVGNWEVPLLLTIAATYFLLERTARYLQDPFSNRPTDTPVTSIARTVEINLKQLVGETEIPGPLAAEGYYLP